MKWKFLIFFGLLFCFSCASLNEKNTLNINYRNYLSENKCEMAADEIPLEKDNAQYLRLYQGTLGYLAYFYSLPLTIGFDFLLMFRCKYGCPAEDKNKTVIEYVFPTTTYTYEQSKDMRCPDTSYYAQKFLEISDCYGRLGDKKSLKFAIDQIRFIEASYNSGPSCLKIRDFQAIRATRERLENQLSKIESNRKEAG